MKWLCEVDAELEEAIERLRERAKRLKRGRITLEVHRFNGVTVEYRIREDCMTEQEIERVMQEPPKVRRGGDV